MPEFSVRLSLLEDGREATYVVQVYLNPKVTLTKAIDEAKQMLVESIAEDYVRRPRA